MFIINNTQLEELLFCMNKWQYIFIGSQIGVDFLNPWEKEMLIKNGVNVEDFKNEKGIIEYSFLFGLLSQALSDERANKMNFDKFKKFVKSGNFIPLTEEEEFSLEQVKTRSYNDISGLGKRISNSISNTIIQSNQKEILKIKETIKEKSIEAIQLRKSATKLASELGELTKDWGRDWLRIAYYITHESFNVGRAQGILRQYGEDAQVYFDVFPDACKHCKILYLINPDDENSLPKIFNIKDIINNGSNIGRKVDEYLPTVSPIHPYCRCIINYYNPEFDWDEDLQSYLKVRKYKSKNSKLKDVKLNIEISKAVECCAL